MALILAVSLAGCISNNGDGLTEALGVDNTPPPCPEGVLVDEVLTAQGAPNIGMSQTFVVPEGCNRLAVDIGPLTFEGELELRLHTSTQTVKLYVDALGAMVNGSGVWSGTRNGDGPVSVQPGTYTIAAAGSGYFSVPVHISVS